MFIPPKKCEEFTAAIDRILDRRSTVTKQEVLSLIGKLRWASACVFAGAAFVRRLELHANKAQRLHHWVKTTHMRKDLIWWRAQIERARVGIPFKRSLAPMDGGDIHVLTDASTGLGMGGWTTKSDDWSEHAGTDIFNPPKCKAPDIFWKGCAA